MPVQEIIDHSATGDLIDAWYPLKRDNGAATRCMCIYMTQTHIGTSAATQLLAVVSHVI
jgi:hypothetical protein